MPDPDTAADTAKPLVPVPPVETPEVIAARTTFESGQPHQAGGEPATPVLLLAAPAEAVMTRDKPLGSVFDSVRAALKARIGGVRAHLADATAGDHRATVAALSKLTDLVHDMFGPDRPEDALRGALVALAAGRDDDARKAFEAAQASLTVRDSHLEPEEADAMTAIELAEAAITAGDRALATHHTETAYDLVE